jgi:hypothetical protein
LRVTQRRVCATQLTRRGRTCTHLRFALDALLTAQSGLVALLLFPRWLVVTLRAARRVRTGGGMILHGAIAIARAPWCACARTLVTVLPGAMKLWLVSRRYRCDVSVGNSERSYFHPQNPQRTEHSSSHGLGAAFRRSGTSLPYLSQPLVLRHAKLTSRFLALPLRRCDKVYLVYSFSRERASNSGLCGIANIRANGMAQS